MKAVFTLICMIIDIIKSHVLTGTLNHICSGQSVDLPHARRYQSISVPDAHGSNFYALLLPELLMLTAV